MKETKVVFTWNEKIKNEILKNITLEEKEKTDSFSIYEWSRELYKDEENLVFIYFVNFSEALKYAKENYDIFKILITGTWNNTWNLDFKSWDVIIPNTFISKEEKNPIFIEYAVWENYDLTKFWLILSWLCISWNPEIEDVFDIREDSMYNNLNEIKKADLLNKTAIVLWINIEEEDDVVNNIYNVIELVL